MSLAAQALAMFGVHSAPVLEKSLVMMIGVLVAVVLEIVLFFAGTIPSIKKMDFEKMRGYYSIVARLFYFPVVMCTVFLCVISGPGGNAGMYGGMADTEIRATFYNLPEWGDTARYFFTFLFFYGILRIGSLILRFRFLRLLRFLVHTVDFIIIGYVLGMLQIVLHEAAQGNFLMTLVWLAFQIPLYILFVYIFIAMVAPLVLIVLPFLTPICMLFGFGVLAAPSRDSWDVLGKITLVNTLTDMWGC